MRKNLLKITNLLTHLKQNIISIMRNLLDLHGNVQPMLYILGAKYRPWISKLLAQMQTKYSSGKKSDAK
jgi:hypothetical protein